MSGCCVVGNSPFLISIAFLDSDRALAGQRVYNNLQLFSEAHPEEQKFLTQCADLCKRKQAILLKCRVSKAQDATPGASAPRSYLDQGP